MQSLHILLFFLHFWVRCYEAQKLHANLDNNLLHLLGTIHSPAGTVRITGEEDLLTASFMLPRDAVLGLCGA